MAPRKKRATSVNARAVKFARPALVEVYERARLFDLLDKARTRPIVWITAPAGAGKTTLVASYLSARKLNSFWYQVDSGDSDPATFFYCLGQGLNVERRVTKGGNKKRDLQDRPTLLTSEYRGAIPVFTANYFRALFGKFKSPGVLVFDNYQDGDDANTTLQDILVQACECVPEGLTMFIVSRQEPPAAYARLRINERMSVLDWEHLKLTEAESAGIVRLRCGKLFPEDALTTLFRETQGWVAGLVLLTERPLERDSSRTVDNPRGSQSVFDYFATEIFRRNDTETQDFLLQTAFLSVISVSLAETLTKQPRSGEILKNLSRRNYFTLRHDNGNYEYHPLFRAFLQNFAAETYPADRLIGIKRTSAELLARKGDVQTAVTLFEQVQDWVALLSLVLAQAPSLAVQGRTFTVETWLAAIPASVTAENPMALYWTGVCRMAFSPAEARIYFERAFYLFERQGDVSSLLLAWSGIIESFVLEHDNFAPMILWLDRYRVLAGIRATLPSDIKARVEFDYVAGLVHAQYDHPDLPMLVQRAEQLLQQDTDVNRRFARAIVLLPYYLSRGDMLNAQKLLESLASHAKSPNLTSLARLQWLLYEAIYAGATGALSESTRVVEEALALAEKSGIHVLDFQFLARDVWNQLRLGNVVAARTLLSKMEPFVGRGRIAEVLYRLRVAAVCLHEGYVERAIEECRKILQVSQDIGFFLQMTDCLFILVLAHIRKGDIGTSLQYVEEVRAIVARAHSKFVSSFCSFVEAIIAGLQGRYDSALRSLSAGLSLAEEVGMSTPPWCPRDIASTLYAVALDEGISVEYVRGVVKKTNLTPPPGYVSSTWPWYVRIYTLGKFSVFVNDAQLSFSGKTQRKPIELLQTLVISGRYGVMREKLSHMLWPDAEGDTARNSLDTTVHRLRKLLGEHSIQTHDDRLSLAPDQCWLDVWAFERVSESIEKEALPVTQTARLLDLYRGPFFEGYDTPAVLVQRQRLQARFMRAVGQLGQAYETRTNFSAAIDLYLKGIEIDPLAEDLYRRLMNCYRTLGRPAEAAAVYRRCHEIFAAVLGIEPAAETKRLIEEIQRGVD